MMYAVTQTGAKYLEIILNVICNISTVYMRLKSKIKCSRGKKEEYL